MNMVYKDDTLYVDILNNDEINNILHLKRQIFSVLNQYGIDVNKCSSINDLIYQIDEILDDEEDSEDLESVSKEISEFNYYANTNK